MHRLRPSRGSSGCVIATVTPAWTRHAPRALAVGDPGYRTVKGILVAGTEHGDDPPAPAPAPPAMLRGPDAFDTERTA